LLGGCFGIADNEVIDTSKGYICGSSSGSYECGVFASDGDSASPAGKTTTKICA